MKKPYQFNPAEWVEAFQLAGINGHVRYDTDLRTLVSKQDNGYVKHERSFDPSRFVKVFNDFFDAYKKEILAERKQNVA